MDSNNPLKNESERLNSEEKTVRSQIRFRTIFETSRLGNKIIGPDLKIIELNDAMVALLGYERKEDIIGTHILDYAPPEFHNHWKTLQNELWEHDRPSFNLETCLKKKDGSIIWCNVTSLLFKDEGQTLGYTIIENITERHNNILKHKEDFISIASHELKTPLTSLQATIELMGSVIKKKTVITEKLIKLSQSAEMYVLRLSNLVEDLLSSTTIEKGQLSLKISRFKFYDLIDKCCKHIRLTGKYYITYQGDINSEIDADENKINQVVVNLVNNAVKYASESKEVIIKVEDLKEAVKISVTDKGKGIPLDRLSHIFNAYYQIKKAGNTGSGMGLGLFISTGIIKKHGGEIGVTSTVGEGSTFWFTIPRNLIHP